MKRFNSIMIIFLTVFALSSFAQTSRFIQPTISSPHSISVLTFNAWDVELLGGLVSPSRHISERFQIIPNKIAEIGPDIIVFQEVWRQSRADQLIKRFQQLGYPYSVYRAGPGNSILGFGNGLLIISVYPLDKPEVISFKSHTRTDESKLLVYKGAIKTKVIFSNIISIDLYAAHLGAFTTVAANGQTPNANNPPDHFISAHMNAKADQAQELAEFIARTRSSPNMLLAADLNTHPYQFINGKYDEAKYSFEYALLTCKEQIVGCVGLTDSYLTANPEKASTGFTFDTVKNIYAKSSPYFSAEPPGRIDYIFYSGPNLQLAHSQLTFNSSLIDAAIKTEQVGRSTPLMMSDHYGVLSIYRITN